MITRARALPAVLFALLVFASPVPSVATDPTAEGGMESGGHSHDDPEELGSRNHPQDFGGVRSLAGASSGMITDFFNESSGCDDPRGVGTPKSSTGSTSNRALPSDHQVRGPWGNFFGRNYGDVRESLVDWEVPMSGGLIVKVHERAYPAFLRVTKNLAAKAARGRSYTVRMASTFSWRRIGGSRRMSTHSFGSTIDINWDTNPYRSDNELVTDMPNWYVRAWKAAGFCWGGDWVYTKDAMHFSWKGPSATERYGNLPGPYPPTTSASSYDQLAFAGASSFGTLDPAARYFFADGNRDGAPDLWRVRGFSSDNLVVEYGWCGASAATVPGAGTAPGEVLIADVDSDAGPDVIVIDDSGETVHIRVQSYRDRYAVVENFSSSTPGIAGGAYGFADYNRDGYQDLYAIGRDGETRVKVWSGADAFASELLNAVSTLPALPKESKWRITLNDWDVDGIPDIVAIKVDGDVQLRIVRGSGAYMGPVTVRSTSATADRAGYYDMGDFDGDGRPDLLVLDPSGDVEVCLGGDQDEDVDFWFRPSNGECDGVVKVSGDLGSALAVGDFDGDGYDDLSAGAPGEDTPDISDAGVVYVLYGAQSSTGLDSEMWHQDIPSIDGIAEVDDRFGESIAVGDFDGDGYDDLVVGASRDGLGGIFAAGLVNVIYGSGSGLDGGNTQLWHQDVSFIDGTAMRGEYFGSVLAVGDFNGDGYDDLAVGVPHEHIDGIGRTGAVNVIYGSDIGLDQPSNQRFRQGVGGLGGAPAVGDVFGSALAVGDFDGDGHDDLAVGVPGDSVRGKDGAGSVQLIYGSEDGLTADDKMKLTQAGRILGIPTQGDHFGSALAVGDFDGDSYADLAVGVPGEAWGGRVRSGKVQVFSGSPNGLTISGQQKWTQSSDGVPGVSQAGDGFGASLVSGNFNGDDYSDLAIGTPKESVRGARSAGSITVLFGTLEGLTSARARRLRSGFGSVVGLSDSGNNFGAAMQAAYVDGDDYQDLLVGIPGADLIDPNAGTVIVVYGDATGLSRRSSQLWP